MPTSSSRGNNHAQAVSGNIEPAELSPAGGRRDRDDRTGEPAGRGRAHRRFGAGGESVRPETSALPGQGEKRDLPIYGRSAEPARSVRSKTGVAEVAWPAAARLADERPEAGVHKAERNNSRQSADVRPIRTERGGVERLPERAMVAHRRQFVFCALHAHRRVQPPAGGYAAAGG